MEDALVAGIDDDDFVPKLVAWNHTRLQRRADDAESDVLEEARDLVLMRNFTPPMELPVLRQGIGSSFGQPVPWIAASPVERRVLDLLYGAKDRRFSVASDGEVFPNSTSGFHRPPEQLPVRRLSPLLGLLADRLQDHRGELGGRMVFSGRSMREASDVRVTCALCGWLLSYVVGDDGDEPDLSLELLLQSLKAPCT